MLIVYHITFLQVLYEYVFMKYALDVPFEIFRQVPRQPILLDGTAMIGSLEGVALAVEECADSPEHDPLTYLVQYQVSSK